MAEEKVKQPIKVLHAPLDFANQAFVLSQALRARGIFSTLLRYQFEANTAPRYYDADDRVAQISRRDWFGDMLRNVQSIAAEGYDIVHFWNRTLLWRRPGDIFNAMDLPFIRLAGPRVAYRFTGYDLRRKSLELQLNPYSPYRYGYESGFAEEDQERYLASVGAYVDQFIVQDPEMQSYCPQARIIPRALDLTRFPLCEPVANPRPLVIHAPSRRAVKGTEFVLNAVDRLKEDGLDFDFRLIENMSNREALEQYRRADVVVDQLLVGWYGVLSMEAMALGKAAIAYIRPDLTGFFGSSMPLLNANPDTIIDVMRSAIADRELREEIGRRGRAFVTDVHDSRIVAGAAVELYKEVLRAKQTTRTPDFSYARGRSTEFAQLLFRGELLQRNQDERARANTLGKEVVAISELQSLRYDARRYNELKPELPTLRYRSQHYDELRDAVAALRAKVDRFERLTARSWGRWILFLLGFRLPKSRRRPRAAAAPVKNREANGSGASDPPHPRSRVAVSSPRAPRPAGDPAAKGTVCILTRKRINNITRAPRMAKALVDAGWNVVVVATGLPVLELQEMCPQVEYIGVTPRAATIERRR
ncbi:MAG TPA: hypothetical protein VFQ82_04980, partial [Stellaceae bacterium]|nr:hypothetical protein [Stellaceae bacterium]